MSLYGKIFSSMFEGSLMGKGSDVIAAWAYVIAHQLPDTEHGSTVMLNPKLMAAQIGATEKEMEVAIELFMAPDPDSATPDKEGRRLVRLSQFEYQVVNGAKYRAIRNEIDRKEQGRIAQAKFREKQKAKKAAARGKALPGEAAFVKAVESGASQEQLDKLSDPEDRKIREAQMEEEQKIRGALAEFVCGVPPQADPVAVNNNDGTKG